MRSFALIRVRIRESVSGIVPITLANWALEIFRVRVSVPFSLALKNKEVGCQPGRYLLEGQIFDLNRELAQAVGQNSEHVERQGRAFVDQIDKGFAGEKKQLAGGDGFGVGREGFTGKYRHLPDGLTGAQDVQDFFLALRRNLLDLDLAGHHQKKAEALLAVGEHELAALVGALDGDALDALEFGIRQPFEKQHVGQQFFDVVSHPPSTRLICQSAHRLGSLSGAVVLPAL